MTDDVTFNKEVCPFCGSHEMNGYSVNHDLTHYICDVCYCEWVD